MGNETRQRYSTANGYTEEDQHLFWLGTGGFVGLILGIVLFCIQLGITDSGASCPEGKQDIFVAECGEPALAILGLILMIVGGVLTLVWVVGWLRWCNARSDNGNMWKNRVYSQNEM